MEIDGQEGSSIEYMLLTPGFTHWHQNTSLSTANFKFSISRPRIYYIFQFEGDIRYNEIHDSASLPRSNGLGR